MTLKEVIALTYAYYNQGRDPLSDQVLLMYAQDLEDLPAEECIKAYNTWRKNPANRTMPLPAHIREMISPDEFISPEIEAREVASRIVGAVTKFGWTGAKDAEAFIGPVGWGVIDRSGGWSHLCQNLGASINPTTFQAQIRDQLEGTIRYGAHVMDSKIKLPARKNLPGELVQANFAKLLGEKPEGEGT